jgi:hypothetical protein
MKIGGSETETHKLSVGACTVRGVRQPKGEEPITFFFGLKLVMQFQSRGRKEEKQTQVTERYRYKSLIMRVLS